MHRRYFAPVAGLAVALILGPGRVSAQPKPLRAETKTARPWIPPRTADGHPDLQGVWANNTATPLERPKELAGRAFLTEAEVAALKKKAAELFDGNGDAEFGDGIFSAVLASVKESEKSPDKGPYKKKAEGFDGKTGDYSSVWLVARDWDNRTSLITDPPDGRLPAMTPEGQKRQAASMAKMVAIPGGPEDRGLSERCITFGSPRLSAGYNSYYQIVQSRDTMEVRTFHQQSRRGWGTRAAIGMATHLSSTRPTTFLEALIPLRARSCMWSSALIAQVLRPLSTKLLSMTRRHGRNRGP
jgi:hypothetical protein